MTLHRLRTAALLAILALAGCSRNTIDTTTPAEDTETRLGEKISIDLAAWLALPRAELAKRADDYLKTIEQQQEGLRTQSASEVLLPQLNPPVTVPVFARAAYRPRAGFSLPDYVKDGDRDPAVALHLARFGDREAALKLAGPNDSALRAAIDASRAARNYPVEWSRLVGLAIVSAQYKLALADVDGATELVLLHQQLGKLLDPQTAAGPLGAALLPAGRRALAQSSKAWRQPRWNKTALADDIDRALKDWGAPGQPPQPGLAIGAAKDQAVALFGTPARGKAVLTVGSAPLARAFDLLALPLPAEGAQCVAAFLSDDGRVAGFAVAYRGKLESHYPDTDHLAYHLDERGLAGKEENKAAGLVRQACLAGNLEYEITRLMRSPGLGAVVRISAVKNGPVPAHHPDPRSLGPISLDRGFEANRLAVNPRLAGPALLLEDRPTLEAVAAPLGLPAPSAAVLQRDPAHDLVASLRLSWPSDVNHDAASRLLPPLFAALGPTAVASAESPPPAHLRFRWQDDRTRVELRLPFDDKPPTVVVEDVQPAGRLQERIHLARQRDEAERQQRLQQGKPQQRLPRSPGLVNDFSLERLTLGLSKAEAVQVLPRGKKYRVKEVPGGLSLLDLHTPTSGQPYWAAQVLLRIDEAGKVSEVRIRYREGLAPARKGESLLDRLNDAKAGVPETLPATWAGLWTDQPARKPDPLLLRWQDDRTVRTYQRDAGGSEVVLRDRTAAEPAPWGFLSRGPAGCSLGAAKESVEKALGAPATTTGGASVYRQPESSPYEMLLVWYNRDRVSRIVAAHRDRIGTEPAEVRSALQTEWARNLDALGALRRQDDRQGPVLGSYFWNDDRTRVRTFIRLEEDSGRVLTEWRDLPIARQ